VVAATREKRQAARDLACVELAIKKELGAASRPAPPPAQAKPAPPPAQANEPEPMQPWADDDSELARISREANAQEEERARAAQRDAAEMESPAAETESNRREVRALETLVASHPDASVRNGAREWLKKHRSREAERQRDRAIQGAIAALGSGQAELWQDALKVLADSRPRSIHSLRKAAIAMPRHEKGRRAIMHTLAWLQQTTIAQEERATLRFALVHITPDLDLEARPFREYLDLLRRQLNASIHVNLNDQELDRKLTFKVRGVCAGQILRLLCNQVGCVYHLDGEAIVIGKPE
jgi:hypothetical protein